MTMAIIALIIMAAAEIPAGVNRWTYYGANPFKTIPDQAVAIALDLWKQNGYLTDEEIDAILTTVEGFPMDTTYVRRGSIVYDLTVYGNGEIRTNVIPDWKKVIVKGRLVPAPDSMLVQRAVYGFKRFQGDSVFVFTNGIVDHYIGDSLFLGCNNVDLKRAALDTIIVRPKTEAGAAPEPRVEEPPTITALYPGVSEISKERRSITALEVFLGAGQVGGQGQLYQGGRATVLPWNGHVGAFVKINSWQTPPIRNPAEYGFGPFDGMVSRFSISGGPYIRFDPMVSYSGFGRQYIDGEWEQGIFIEQELAFRFHGVKGLHPSFETLAIYLPEHDFLWLRERVKISMKRWEHAVLRLGGQAKIEGDERALFDPKRAGYYSTQSDVLVEFYKHYSSRFIDGLSSVGLVGYSNFGWAVGLEISLLIHDSWRRLADIPNGN